MSCGSVLHGALHGALWEGMLIGASAGWDECVGAQLRTNCRFGLGLVSTGHPSAQCGRNNYEGVGQLCGRSSVYEWRAHAFYVSYVWFEFLPAQDAVCVRVCVFFVSDVIGQTRYTLAPSGWDWRLLLLAPKTSCSAREEPGELLNGF